MFFKKFEKIKKHQNVLDNWGFGSWAKIFIGGFLTKIGYWGWQNWVLKVQKQKT